MLSELYGRVAVITGAAGGLGLAMAQQCLAQGMRVALIDCQAPRLEKATADLSDAADRLMTIHCDVADWNAMQSAAEQLRQRWGGAQLLVNNAGVAASGPLLDCPVDDWQWMFGVNVMGVVHGCKAFIPDMLASGAPGQVVNVASVAGLLSPPGLSIYSASKHAVVGLSESLHHELALQQAAVGVSLLCPGWVRTGIGTSGVGHGNREGTLGRELAAALFRAISGAGTTPEQVAIAMLDAVRTGRFWVLTHPEFETRIEARHQTLMGGTTPVRPPL